jgi:long-chain acyl-CoA synthetase
MLYRALELQAKKHPHKTAVIGESRSLSYGQLWQEVKQAALYFQQSGLRRGDQMVVGIPPSPEFYVLFYAAAALGVATIPVSSSGKLPAQIRSLEAASIAGDQAFVNSVAQSGLGYRQAFINNKAHGFSIPLVPGSLSRRRIIRKENILGTSTSGTTGEPLLLIRPADAIYERAKLGGDAWEITSEDILLSTGPFTSGVNAVYHLVLPIIQGSTVVVMEKFERRKVVDMISRQKVTVLFAVPIIFDVLARLPLDYRVDFSTLKRCISGGSHLTSAISIGFYQRFGIWIGQGYGGTHFAPAFTVNPGATPGAVGQKNGLFPVRIVNAQGYEATPGKTGEIVFDLPRVKNSWAKTVLRRNPNRRGRYIYTGDLGRFDDQGNLFVVGRKDAIIKVGANRVSPAEVEDVLRSHPRVRDAIVFPVRPGQTDEAVGAVVIRNGRLTAEELIDHCARQLDPHKCPHAISFRKSLPRNTHGKVIRYLFEQSSRQS